MFNLKLIHFLSGVIYQLLIVDMFDIICCKSKCYIKGGMRNALIRSESKRLLSLCHHTYYHTGNIDE